MAVVISDAGPLIALAKVDRLRILRQLFGRVVIPEAVWSECVQHEGEDTRRIEDAVARDWLIRTPVEVRDRFPRSLGRGEVEALQLAINADSSLLIVDDRLARREAMRLGLSYIGTARVLSLAEQRSLIDDAEDVLLQMTEHGYRISPQLLRQMASSGSAGRKR